MKKNEIEKNRVNEILTLHNEIAGYLKMSVEKAVKIGRLLQEQKSALPHGEFVGWIELNMPFSDRTARNYMRLHENRDKLETVSDLTSAYKLLSPSTEDSKVEDWHSYVQRQKRELHSEMDSLDDIPDIYQRLTACKLIYDKLLWLTQSCAEVLLYTEARLGQLLDEQTMTSKLQVQL
ncbi:MAG: DUF3102 domain-containing protein [Planctomycetes bacterium]|nr:DUF3102 domain-containing protein [Planctomycetota bacterium]